MMNRFDLKLKKKIKCESNVVPQNVIDHISLTLEGLPEKETKRARRPVWRPALISTAAVFLLCLFVLPNVSAHAASVMEQIPIIGRFIKVVTIRNYIYHDDYHDLKADIPLIEDDSNISGSAADTINASVEDLTDRLLDTYYADIGIIGDQAHTALKIDYDVKTNSDKWFTLKINIYEVTGSGNSYYKIYHIDKQSGNVAQLSDLFENKDYIPAITSEVQKQMRAQMEQNDHIHYWLNSEYPEWDFTKIQENQNFYFNESGKLVISFDKYEVGPGATGTPEFEIPKEVYKSYLKENFKDIP